ncbi:MAG: hypothetical protein GF404_00125 [candidate division Zixibacteria bacterium]|nr:hypothetical protein [candidate division Zixibacteria bacterium]
MDIIQAVILGLIQGLTEFLPVSSSGHLVLGKLLFGVKVDNIIFEVFVHFATFLAVVAFFFREIVILIKAPLRYVFVNDRSRETVNFSKYVLFIAVGTIPAVIVGLYFKEDIEQAFSSARLVGMTLLVTTALLFLTALVKPKREGLRFLDGILIGLAQALAILPGISRSGATISTAMYLGVDKSTAFKFSFLLSLPAIFGAFILQLKDALEIGLPKDQIYIYLAGMLCAFISGYVCLVILRKIVIAGKFAWFGVYTLIIGVLTLVFAHG